MGTNMLFQFDQEARKALAIAQSEAERRQQPQIGIEHLLLGLLDDPTTTAGRILEQLGVDRVQVEATFQRRSAEQVVLSPRLDLSPETKKIMELAVREARQRGHRSIGTGHLLMAFVWLEEASTTHLLADLNVAPDDLRRHLDQALSEAVGLSLEERIRQRLLETDKPVELLTIAELRVQFDDAVKQEHLLLDPLARRRLLAEIIATILG